MARRAARPQRGGRMVGPYQKIEARHDPPEMMSPATGAHSQPMISSTDTTTATT